MSTPTILVAGTWDEKNYDIGKSWIDDGSDFVSEALIKGVNLIDLQEPFIWSTLLDGYSPRFWKKNHQHMVWASWGRALLYYAHWKAPNQAVNIIAHSHGGQVAAYAMNFGLKIENLVTVATPVRKDMRKIWTGGRMNLGTWYHMHTGHRDIWQAFGELGDGTFGINRQMPPPAINEEWEGEDHRSLLNINLWNEDSLWDWVT